MSCFIIIFSINLILLNKIQKEELVINMLKEGKPIREIAESAQKSFSDIGEIKRRVFGESDSQKEEKTV
jgi:hypothetical protein